MNTCDEDIEADDKIIAEEGERELYEHFRFVADKGQNLLRVDKFLVARLESSSRNRVQQAARSWRILVNGKAGQVELSRKSRSMSCLSSWIDPDTNSRSYPKTYRSMSYTKTKPSWLSTNRQDWSYTPDTGIIAGHW